MIKGEQNEFFHKLEAAIENKDLDGMVELMHPECTMVLHSTGKIIRRDEWKETFGKMITSDKFKRDKNRCIYENDDIMVEHAMVTFPNGSTDAVLVVMTLKDGKVFRTETCSTPLNK